jgi:hypothetical protein
MKFAVIATLVSVMTYIYTSMHIRIMRLELENYAKHVQIVELVQRVQELEEKTIYDDISKEIDRVYDHVYDKAASVASFITATFAATTTTTINNNNENDDEYYEAELAPPEPPNSHNRDLALYSRSSQDESSFAVSAAAAALSSTWYSMVRPSRALAMLVFRQVADFVVYHVRSTIQSIAAAAAAATLSSTWYSMVRPSAVALARFVGRVIHFILNVFPSTIQSCCEIMAPTVYYLQEQWGVPTMIPRFAFVVLGTVFVWVLFDLCVRRLTLSESLGRIWTGVLVPIGSAMGDGIFACWEALFDLRACKKTRDDRIERVESNTQQQLEQTQRDRTERLEYITQQKLDWAQRGVLYQKIRQSVIEQVEIEMVQFLARQQGVFDITDLDSGANQRQIRRLCNRRRLVYHPDRGGNVGYYHFLNEMVDHLDKYWFKDDPNQSIGMLATVQVTACMSSMETCEIKDLPVCLAQFQEKLSCPAKNTLCDFSFSTHT